MFTVYVVKCEETGKFYIGQTSDLEQRLNRHNKLLPIKKTSYTYKNGNIWKLVYKEKFSIRKDAIRREKELKSHRGRDFLKSKLNGGVCRMV